MFYTVLLLLSLTSIVCAQPKTLIELEPISKSKIQKALKDGRSYNTIRDLLKKEKITTADLKKAVKKDRPDIAHLFLNNGALPDEETILYCAQHCQNLHAKNRARWWHLYQWLHSVKEAYPQNTIKKSTFYFMIKELID